MKTLWISSPRSMYIIPLLFIGILDIFQALLGIHFDHFILPGNAAWWLGFLGLTLLCFSVAIMRKKMERIIPLMVALLLSFFVAGVYVPNLSSDDVFVKGVSIFNMSKDMILAACSLMYAGFVSVKM